MMKEGVFRIPSRTYYHTRRTETVLGWRDRAYDRNGLRVATPLPPALPQIDREALCLLKLYIIMYSNVPERFRP